MERIKSTQEAIKLREIVLMPDENIRELGLGDVVNKFACLKAPEGSKIVISLPTSIDNAQVNGLPEVIADIIKNKKNIQIEYRDSKQRTDVQIMDEKNEHNPNVETEIVFLENELEWAKNILAEIRINKDEKIVAICNNIPSGTIDKMWTSEEWANFLSSTLATNPTLQIVLLPNFRTLDDVSDQSILDRLKSQYPKATLVSFQAWVKEHIDEITAMQEIFGKSKNRVGLSIRQFAAIIHELMTNSVSVGVFNDSGPAHLSAAALGKEAKMGQIVSVNVEREENYAPRNGGKAFTFSDKFQKIKTDPLQVAEYVNKILSAQ